MKKIHFIGIGGIGLSALARFLKKEGYEISGSDMRESAITKALKKEGIKVSVPHTNKAIIDQDLVICSAVIKDTNVEVIEAKKRGIKIESRKEALKWILKNKKVFGVAGAHGKSTTSAMLSSIMDKSMLIGAESKQYGSNMRYCESDIVVFEADESDASFLNSNPYVAIVTNAEPEHMEYYKYNYEEFYNSYKKFIKMAKIRVINAEDNFLKSLNDIEAIRLYPSKDIKNIHTIIKNKEPYTSFELKDFGVFEVWGIGEHIALDASLSILASINFMPLEKIKKNLKKFKGIKKRFDVVEAKDDFVVIDDYAHHPTEIKASIKSFVTYSKLLNISPITAIWQPHKYSRTIDNLEGFKCCFDGVDNLIILPVWNVGEERVEIDFKNHFKQYNPILVDRVNKKNYINLIANNRVVNSIENGLIVGFGAGDITYQLRGA